MQTCLPKTKCVWPMKINVICTVEQNQRKNNVRIIGLKEESTEENTPKYVVKFLNEALKMKLDYFDLANAYRVRNQLTTPRDILVQFISNIPNVQLMSRRKNLRDFEERIYINDDLTKYRAFMYKATREKVRVWQIPPSEEKYILTI